MRFDQRLLHLFAALSNKKFGASGKEKERTNSDARHENADPFQRMQFPDEDSCRRHRSNTEIQRASRQWIEQTNPRKSTKWNHEYFLATEVFSRDKFA